MISVLSFVGGHRHQSTVECEFWRDYLIFREMIMEPYENGMRVRYRINPVMRMEEYEGRLILSLSIINGSHKQTIGPIEIIENESRCTHYRVIDGFTEFENNTLGFGFQFFQEIQIKDQISLYPCLLKHIPSVTVQALSDHSTEYNPSCYHLSSSNYLFQIPAIPAGHYNLRVYLNGTFITTLYSTVRSSFHVKAVDSLSSPFFVNEEGILHFTVLDNNNEPFTDIASTEIQVLVLNEGTSLDYTNSFNQTQMEIRFTPDKCSQNNSFVMICIDDCITQSLNIGSLGLSHA